MDVDDGEGELQVASCMAPRFQPLFVHRTFNAMQSILSHQILDTDENVVVAAPTGSGKTVIHELAIVRLLQKKGEQQESKIKVLFIAPNKALCQQRVTAWQKTFGKVLGLQVLEVTGDMPNIDVLKSITKANIVICTPEKWDSLTRIWRQHLFLLGTIDLLLLDEVHFLGEDRGGTLEVVVVRMRRVTETYQSRVAEAQQQMNPGTAVEVKAEGGGVNVGHMRIIALSATLPNLNDIGDFLKCRADCVHFFDESFRPVPLETFVESYSNNSNNAYLFEKSLDAKVESVIKNYSDDKQVLIFCSSKKGTETLAASLSLSMGRRGKMIAQPLLDRCNALDDVRLKDLVKKGFAYHHAGLGAEDRATVEALFLSGHIHVLATTSTLAHGVNLPAYLVIIKGTNCWRGGTRGYEKISKMDIIQMMGRAGRPGFDVKGRAVIMTGDKDSYRDVSLHAELVESTLPNMLTEAVCSEVTATVIRNVEEALEWLRDTYFYVRVRKNPTRYGFEAASTDEEVLFITQCLALKAVEALSEARIVKYDSEADPAAQITPNAEAFIMTKHMINVGTMKLLMNMANSFDVNALLNDLSKSDALHKPLRRDEKKVLNDSARAMRFPTKSKDRVKDSISKAYILMQIAVSRVHLSDFSLRIEQSEIVESALRILSALFDYCIERQKGALLEATVLLQRALQLRNWGGGWDSPYLQIDNLPAATRKAITDKKLQVDDGLAKMDEAQIAALLECQGAVAREIKQLARILDAASRKVCLTVEKNNMLVIDILQQGGSSSSSSSLALPADLRDRMPTCQVICYDASSGQLICHRSCGRCSAADMTFTVPLLQYRLVDVTCLLIFSLSGIDNVHRPSARNNKPSSSSSSSAPVRKKEPRQTTISLKSVPRQPAQAKPPTTGIPSARTSNESAKTVTPTRLLNEFGGFAYKGTSESSSSVAPSASSAFSSSSSKDASQARQPAPQVYQPQPARSFPQAMKHSQQQQSLSTQPMLPAQLPSQSIVQTTAAAPQAPSPRPQVMHSNEAYEAYVNQRTGSFKTPTSGLHQQHQQGPQNGQQGGGNRNATSWATQGEQHLNALRRKGDELHLDRLGAKRMRGTAAHMPVQVDMSTPPHSLPRPAAYAFTQQHNLPQQRQSQTMHQDAGSFFDVQNFRQPGGTFFEAPIADIAPPSQQQQQQQQQQQYQQQYQQQPQPQSSQYFPNHDSSSHHQLPQSSLFSGGASFAQTPSTPWISASTFSSNSMTMTPSANADGFDDSFF